MEQEKKDKQMLPGQDEKIGVENDKKPSREDPALLKIGDELGSISRSLRMLEERYITLRKKIQVSDQNIIDDTNNMFNNVKLITKDIGDLKLSVEEMRQKLDVFSEEIKEMASKHELKVLQKYVDMWEPMQFITKKQALILLKEAKSKKTEE